MIRRLKSIFQLFSKPEEMSCTPIDAKALQATLCHSGEETFTHVKTTLCQCADLSDSKNLDVSKLIDFNGPPVIVLFIQRFLIFWSIQRDRSVYFMVIQI